VLFNFYFGRKSQLISFAPRLADANSRTVSAIFRGFLMSRCDNEANPQRENFMRIHFQDVSEDFSNAVEEMKRKHVILTKEGVPVALVQSLRPATADEERAIHEMIDLGLLQPGRRSGAVREWKWKSKTARSSAA